MLGNVKNTLVWRDVWVERKPLYLKFNRLFRLSEQHDSLVGDVGTWNVVVWSWDFKWTQLLMSINMV